MNKQRFAMLAASSLAILASVAVGTALQAPNIWVVDDNGGAGVNFTALQPAIDAASPGDLILVRPGFYGSFDLPKALTILGEKRVRVDQGVIHDIADMTAVAELEFRDLVVRDCTGTIVLDRVWGRTKSSGSGHPTVLVENSSDVRMIELDRIAPGVASLGMEPQITVRASRVELTSSDLEGRPGKDKSTGYAGDGSPAVLVEAGGYLHLSRSSLLGGDGGDITSLGYGDGGVGGAALELSDGEAFVTGRGAELFQGGRGGSIILYGYAGDGGDGIEVSSTSSVRYSQVKLSGGKPGGYTATSGGSIQVAPGGSSKLPKFADPVLERLGDPVSGAAITLKLRSQPGAFSRLFWGFTPIVQSTPGVVVDRLLMKEATIPIGIVPANGVLVIPYTVDPLLPAGTVIYLQAMSVFPKGKIRRTNSVPIVVR